MKNKTLSKIFAVTMATMTTFSLVACGGGGSTSRGDKVNLEFVHYWPEHATLLKELCQEFSAANPNITITPTNVPYSNIESQLMNMLRSGGLPDVFCYWSNQSYNFANDGYLADMDAFVAEEKGNYVNDAFSLEDGKINGHYYAAPFRASGYVIVYNEKMFNDNDWDVPETLEDLEALCYDVIEKSSGELTPLAVYGTSSGTMMQVKSTFDAYVNILTGLVNDPAYYCNRQDASKEAGLQELYADALVKFKKWYDAGFFTLDPQTRDNAQKEFTNGKTPMILFNNNNLDVLEETIGNDFEIGAISFPAPKVVQDLNLNTYTNGTFDSLFIAKSTKNYDAAMSFVKYLMSDAVQQKWAEKTRSVSLKKNVTYASAEQERMATLLSQLGAYPQKADFTLSTDASSKTYTLINNYLTSASNLTAVEVVQQGFANTVASVTDDILNPGKLTMIEITTDLDYSDNKYTWLK
ncbi:MAG: extracellular solute-binding protein [Clostridiales bacterium]|nr:extracellular solute-binding protein [Clostridiales bacterium]